MKKDIDRIERSIEALKLQVNGLRSSIHGLTTNLDRISYRDDDEDDVRVANPLAPVVQQLRRDLDTANAIVKNYKERLEYALAFQHDPAEFRRLVVEQTFLPLNGYLPDFDGDDKTSL